MIGRAHACVLVAATLLGGVAHADNRATAEMFYRAGERAERGELILHEAATHLGVSKMTVIRLIKAGSLPARQVCPGAPYVIRQDDLNRPSIQRVVAGGRAVPHDERQESLAYQ